MRALGKGGIGEEPQLAVRTHSHAAVKSVVSSLLRHLVVMAVHSCVYFGNRVSSTPAAHGYLICKLREQSRRHRLGGHGQ